MEGFESKTDSWILDTYWIKKSKDNHQKFFEPKHYHQSRI